MYLRKKRSRIKNWRKHNYESIFEEMSVQKGKEYTQQTISVVTAGFGVLFKSKRLTGSRRKFYFIETINDPTYQNRILESDVLMKIGDLPVMNREPDFIQNLLNQPQRPLSITLLRATEDTRSPNTVTAYEKSVIGSPTISMPSAFKIKRRNDHPKPVIDLCSDKDTPIVDNNGITNQDDDNSHLSVIDLCSDNDTATEDNMDDTNLDEFDVYSV